MEATASCVMLVPWNMNLLKATSIPGKGAGLDVGWEGKIWDVITSIRTRVEAVHALLDLVEPDVPQPIHSTYPCSILFLSTWLPSCTWDAQSKESWWSQSHLPQFSIVTSRDAVQQLLEHQPVVLGSCVNGALDDIRGELQSTLWETIVLTFCH